VIEFIVIVESGADARTATKLAERVLIEQVDWLYPELIKKLLLLQLTQNVKLGFSMGLFHLIKKNKFYRRSGFY
jgi:hypothetical protein